jgi:hypothetical protein
MTYPTKIYYKDGSSCIFEFDEEVVKVAKLIKRTQLKFDFRGLWYTSQGLFVEVLGIEGFVLDEKGNRLQIVRVDQNGYLSPIGGRLEIAKRNYIKSEDTKVVQRGKIDKEWPPCQTQF